MVRFTVIVAALIAAATLTACGTPSTDRAVANARSPELKLLTPEQEAVLQDGVKDNVVYDAVDGGHVVKL